MKEKKTALVLGGGGSRGAYEVGVWQALRELGIGIDIACGTSVGSINAAMVVQDSFDVAVNLWNDLDTGMIFDIEVDKGKKKQNKAIIPEIAGIPLEEAKAYAKEIVTNGGAESSGLAAILNKYIDEEAVRNSPVEYGLTTVELPNFVPHYLYKETIPKGKLTDYIIASSSVAPAIKPHKIDGKDFIDGGFADVVPITLALDKGADNIIAVNLNAVGIMRKDKFKEAEAYADMVKTISCAWDMGNMLVFDKNNSKRLIRLGYLDGMKAFDVFSGELYAFSKGEFDKKTLKEAEAAGKLFELDPGLIYKKEIFNNALKESIQSQQSVMNRELAALPDKKRNQRNLLKELALEAVSLISGKVSRKSLTILIAEDLKDGEKDSVLTSRAARKLFPDEIAAANYIIKYRLL